MMQTRNLRGIISETFRVYGERFGPFVGVVAVVQVPLAILGARLGSRIDQVETITLGWVISFVMVILGLAVLNFVGSTAIHGALVQAVFQSYQDAEVSIVQCYEVVWHRIWSLLGATILGALAVLGMVITVIGIPFAVYFGVRWTLAYQAVVLEGVGARSALSRSSFLVRGGWWRVAGIEVVLGLIQGILSGIVGLIVSGILSRWSETLTTEFANVATSLVQMLFMPIGIIGVTLLYFDVRARKEGAIAE